MHFNKGESISCLLSLFWSIKFSWRFISVNKNICLSKFPKNKSHAKITWFIVPFGADPMPRLIVSELLLLGKLVLESVTPAIRQTDHMNTAHKGSLSHCFWSYLASRGKQRRHRSDAAE